MTEAEIIELTIRRWLNVECEDEGQVEQCAEAILDELTRRGFMAPKEAPSEQ